ncbi:MAG: hypothetical protein H6837_01290 [Planctomycetes bacterium]|nr:hypothetical protein [Planctomycetota bacterium]
MKWVRRIGLVAVLAIAVLLCYLAIPPSRTAAHGSGGAVSELTAGHNGENVSTDSAGARTPTRAEDRADSPLLVLTVRDAAGKPASGLVSWRATPEPDLSGDALPMFAGEKSGSVHQANFQDTASIRLPAGHWLWLKVTPAHRLASAWFLRVPPFRGMRRKTLVLDDTTRALHVFVWNATLTGPCADGEVSLYAAEGAGSAPVPVQRLRTDAHGYALAQPLPPGGFLVCGPGSSPGDTHPFTAHMMLPAGVPVAELSCSVAARAPCSFLRLTVVVAPECAKALQGAGGKLFLKRKDDGSGAAVPLPGLLVEGKTTHRVAVAPGTYEIACLPAGCVTIRDTERYVSVAAGREQAATVAVAAGCAVVRLSLIGIPQHEFPITVHARADAALIDEDSRLVFLGPYRWRTPDAQVAGLPRSVVLVAHSRHRPYVSIRPLELRATTGPVPMTAATRLQVTWLGPRAVACRDPILVARSSHGQNEVLLRRTLARDGSRIRPALEASLVVPAGLVDLTCRSAAGEHWQRRVDASAGPALPLVVPEGG